MTDSRDDQPAEFPGKDASAILLSKSEELTNSGCFEWNIENNEVRWTAGLSRIYGLDPKHFEATFKAFMERVIPEDRENVQQAIQKAIQDRGTFELRERIQHTTGEIRTIESRGQVMLDEDGNASKLIGVCRDVTNHVEDERTRQWQIEGLELLAASASAMMVSHDELQWSRLFTDVGKHLGCDGFANFSLEDGRLQLEAIAGFPLHVAEQLQTLELGENFCGYCAETQEFVYLGGEALRKHSKASALWDLGFRLAVSVPLVVESRLFGTLSFVSSDRTSLNESELDFVQTVGKLVAAAKAQKFYERQMAENERRFRMIVDNTADALFIFDLEGNFLDVNREACKTLGYTRDELLRKNVRDIELDLPESFPEKCLTNGASPLQEGRHRRKDGTEFAVEVRANSIQYRGREAILAAARDITKRLEVQRQKLRAEETSRLVLEHAKLATWEADPETLDFLFLSGHLNALGFSSSEWLEPGFWMERVHKDDIERVVKRVRGTSSDGERIEFRMRDTDGQFVWVEMIVETVIENEVITSLRGVLADISARKLLEEQLLHSQKMEAVGRLAGGIAHDFNNLLTVINTCAELMLMDLPESPPDSDSLNGILDTVHRAKGLTDQLLMFGRTSVYHPCPLDLNTIVEDSERLLRRLIGEDIQLTKSLTPNRLNILVDPSHMDQLIMNIAINARDAMPEGGRLDLATLLTEVKEGDVAFTELPPGQYVELKISDSGIGMTDEVSSMIFEPFYTTKPVGHGSGLGLSVVYGVIREAGGAISVNSAPNAGAEFRILLPATNLEAKDVKPEVKEPQLYGSERILLVEDEAAVRQTACAALRLFGYEVLEADSGNSAKHVVSKVEGDIALLLTDLVMPDFGGIELADEVCLQFPDIKVLCLSGYSDSVLRYEATNYPFLPKPFTVQGLVGKVREVLDGRSANAAVR